MGVTLVLVPPHADETVGWPEQLMAEVPGLTVVRPDDTAGAVAALRDADAAYGALPADLLAVTTRLRWLQAPQAGPPPGFYHQALVEHPVQVTNMRDTYTDHVATHTVALVLALARGIPSYVRAQGEGQWAPDWDPASVLTLAETTALVVGAGAIGAAVGRLLAAFGVRVTGVDERVTEPPPGFATVVPPSSLDSLLPGADIVVLTVPHTPATEGMMDLDRFGRFKPSCYFVNVGRGPTVRLDDLVAALDAGLLRGAALDVFETEPLPADHPLWTRTDVLLTPHVASAGPYAGERRFAVLLENARRFVAGEPLVNVVDKAMWF
jgi:phosphoglycerate dehydrogenase-like enzyme